MNSEKYAVVENKNTEISRPLLNHKASFWRLIPFLVAALILIPVVVVFSSFLMPADDVWKHLVDTALSTLLVNTFWLSVGVVVGTSLLGVSLAWLTAIYQFPGSRFFSWALLLPLAIPAYVTAFIVLGLFDYTGPIQTALRTWLGSELPWFPDLYGRGGVTVVMILAFYPYVYLMARNAFLTQGKRLLEVAQSLGLNRKQGFFKVALPMARPWIAGGIMLTLMETLADFGTVSVFNYDTFTTAIYKAWFGMFSLPAASQLASLLITLVFVLIIIEQQFRARMRFAETKRSSHADRIVLSGWKACTAICFAASVLFIAFVLPIMQLSGWAVHSLMQSFDQRYLEFLLHSLLLSAMATLITCFVAILLVYAVRLYSNTFTRIAVRIATIGYALPGAVLAVGIFIPLAWLDDQLNGWLLILFQIEAGLLIQGTVGVMLIAYMTRFLAVAHYPIDSAMQRITRSIDEAAMGFGLTGWAVLRSVHLPMLKTGIFTAAALVFVDVMKEMPITLMTRPFGWDTLAVRIFSLTSEGEWQQAALPAVTLVLAGLVPIILLMRQTDK
ncbi:iron(III) transport system permease protein [Nitrosomonas communis]|uniref:Iron(III) transport system permease protein n=2 Tax=Nitrosomonas communis TaxID=44574 RepID=A0A1H2SEV4_9PROT|nr:iron(III) transport system permease protein [Nitrosomonas communis]